MDRNHIMGGLALTILATVWAPALAETVQSHESIRQAAENFIVAELRTSQGVSPVARAGHLDSRLRLSDCSKPLEAFHPNTGRSLGNTTVGVRCSGAKPWTLYVPVAVSVYEKVVVAARSLARGELLQAKDVILAERDIVGLRSGYFTEATQAVGKQVTRNLTSGMALTASMVKASRQIKRGQQVNLIVGTDSLQVHMIGEALSDGAAGERIRVRNKKTNRVVEGVVQSASTIRVAM